MLCQAFANVQARRQHEGIGNAAAHNELIHFVGQALQNGQFGGHFAAAHNGGQGSRRKRQCFGDGINFCSQQRACARHFGVLGNAIGGAFCAVRGTKGIVHKNVAQCRHFLSQFWAVLFLTLVHSAVFKQDHLACGHFNAFNPIGLQRHLTA